MAEDLITLSKEKYDKAGTYGDISQASGMASMFTRGMGAILDYSALKRDLRNYDLQVMGTELATQSVENQALQIANKLRQQYIEDAGNYVYNAARRGVDVNSGSVQSNLRHTSEEMGKNIQDVNRNAEIKKKDLQLRKVALQAEKKIKKYNARAGLAMTGIDLATEGAMKMMTAEGA